MKERDFDDILTTLIRGNVFCLEIIAEEQQCHKKDDAEIATSIRLDQKVHFYLLNPQFRRERSTSNISDFVRKYCFKNIFLSNTVLNHGDMAYMKRKLELLKSKPQFSTRIVTKPDGVLLNFTEDECVYLDGVPMLRVEDIQLM